MRQLATRYVLCVLILPSCAAAICEAGGIDDDGNPLPDLAIARLGSLRWRWHGPTQNNHPELAFSNDGKALVASSDNGRFAWDAATGKPLRSRQIAAATNLAPRFRMDLGARTVTVHDERAHKQVAGVTAIAGLCAAAVADDGKRLAIIRRVSRDGGWELQVCDLPGAIVRHAIQRANYIFLSPVFSPDHRWLATRGNNAVYIWDTASGKLAGQHAGASWTGTFSPDGRLLACVDVDRIRLYSVPTFKLVRTLGNRSRGLATLAFSADGKRLAAADEDSAAIWDIATGSPIAPIPGHTSSLVALAFTADGKRLASSAFREGDACIWDLASRKERQRFGGHFCEATALAFTADGRMLATGDGNLGSSGGGERHIRLWSTGDGKLVQTFAAHVNEVRRLEFAPDGKTLLSIGGDERIRLWDVRTGARLAQIRGAGAGLCAQFASDGSAILADDGAGALSLWQPNLRSKLRDLWVPNGTASSLEFACFVKGGSHVLAVETHRPIVTEEGQLEQRLAWLTWDPATGKGTRQARVLRDPPPTAYYAVAPDGRTIVWSGGPAGRVDLELWDADTKARLGRLPSASTLLAFSPDSRILATGEADGTILLWDLTRARRMQLFEHIVGDTGPAVAVARSLAADSKRAVALLKPLLTKFADDDRQIAPLIAALDSASFDERDRATRKLEAIGVRAESWLRSATARPASLEVKRRLERLVARLPVSKSRANQPPPFDAERALVTVRILEQLDIDDAWMLLAEIAAGAPQTEVGRAAQAAVARAKKPRPMHQPR